MNILGFTKALAPTNDRKTALSNIRDLKAELDNYLIPGAESVMEAFDGGAFKSDYGKRLTRALTSAARFSGNGLDVVYQSLKQERNQLDVIEKEISRRFGTTFSSSNLSFDRVTLLQYVENAGFYTRYAAKLMLRLVAEEAQVVGSATPMSWSKAERQWSDDNLSEFVKLLKVFLLDTQQLKQKLSRASHAIVAEETTDMAHQTLSPTEMDPLSFNLVSPTTNPIFRIHQAIADWQVNRYKAAREEHQALSLRLVELKDLRSGDGSDPRHQKLIKATENRIEELAFRLNKMQEDAFS